jgi:hypothetical protein
MEEKKFRCQRVAATSYFESKHTGITQITEQKFCLNIYVCILYEKVDDEDSNQQGGQP